MSKIINDIEVFYFDAISNIKHLTRLIKEVVKENNNFFSFENNGDDVYILFYEGSDACPTEHRLLALKIENNMLYMSVDTYGIKIWIDFSDSVIEHNTLKIIEAFKSRNYENNL